MKKEFLERKARDLLLRIWEERNNLWPECVPERPIDMIEPELAARVLGVSYELEESLGQFGNGRNRFEVAGVINRQAEEILISKRFPLEVRRFTGAHEIGHWVLHPGEVAHRDRPINGSKVAREPKEWEADYFAACFLMPAKLVRSVIEQTFGIAPPIRIDDNVAFWLCRDEPEELLRATAGSDIRERTLASVETFNGRRFNSLTKQFRVSREAIAIRLKELDIFA